MKSTSACRETTKNAASTENRQGDGVVGHAIMRSSCQHALHRHIPSRSMAFHSGRPVGHVHGYGHCGTSSPRTAAGNASRRMRTSESGMTITNVASGIAYGECFLSACRLWRPIEIVGFPRMSKTPSKKSKKIKKIPDMSCMMENHMILLNMLQGTATHEETMRETM